MIQPIITNLPLTLPPNDSGRSESIRMQKICSECTTMGVYKHNPIASKAQDWVCKPCYKGLKKNIWKQLVDRQSTNPTEPCGGFNLIEIGKSNRKRKKEDQENLELQRKKLELQRKELEENSIFLTPSSSNSRPFFNGMVSSSDPTVSTSFQEKLQPEVPREEMGQAEILVRIRQLRELLRKNRNLPTISSSVPMGVSSPISLPQISPSVLESFLESFKEPMGVLPWNPLPETIHSLPESLRSFISLSPIGADLEVRSELLRLKYEKEDAEFSKKQLKLQLDIQKLRHMGQEDHELIGKLIERERSQKLMDELSRLG